MLLREFAEAQSTVDRYYLSDLALLIQYFRTYVSKGWATGWACVSDEFVGTARMVFIYGRKYDVIVQGRIQAHYHNHNKPMTDFYVEVS